jgi:hypothetical protein
MMRIATVDDWDETVIRSRKSDLRDLHIRREIVVVMCWEMVHLDHWDWTLFGIILVGSLGFILRTNNH